MWRKLMQIYNNEERLRDELETFFDNNTDKNIKYYISQRISYLRKIYKKIKAKHDEMVAKKK